MNDVARQQFCEAFAFAKQELKMSDREMAKLLQVSLPTVGRWARGEAAPHPIGRPVILRALGRLLRGAQ